MPVNTLTNYKNWKPVFHKVIKNEKLAGTIHEKGYAVIPFLSDTQLQQVIDLYNKEHSLSVENGGMFYSLYSKDLNYRKRVHQTLAEIFKPLLDVHFTDYKNIVNTFITKSSGPESEFYTHQDTTALDEFEHSPLSIWIPLQDITPENGALSVVEKTHWFFSPYRGVSFSFPFNTINSTVRDYLRPVYLKAGEALIFDPRLIHNSMPNISGKDRLVALCGIFPKNAEFITCYKAPEPGSPIERIKHPDSYILEHENFYYNCHDRPKTGVVIEKITEGFPEMNAETFEKLCELNSIERVNALGSSMNIPCKMIAEPDGINKHASQNVEQEVSRSIWQKIKTVFN